MTGKGGLSYEPYDLVADGVEPLMGLYRRVYGGAVGLPRRWRWEFEERPAGEEVQLFAAWDGENPVAMTARLPCRLIIDGESVTASFAADTMVDPSWRGKGVVRELYGMAASSAQLQLSKGTAPGMYRVLLEMGYREVAPDNYQVCLLAPFRWLAGKLFAAKRTGGGAPTPPLLPGEFRAVDRFGLEHEALARTGLGPAGGVVKSAAWLNWRYVDIPHRGYHRFVRMIAGDAVSLIVLRLSGSTAFLVDLRWESAASDEPAVSIRFAKGIARRMGAAKMVGWGTLEALRKALARQLFLNVSDTPHFSFYPVDGRFEHLDWTKIHLVHGDGDTEYL